MDSRMKVVFEPSEVTLHVPRLFADASIEVIADEQAKSLATYYVENFTPLFLQGHAPLLLGASGLGKTFIAAAIAKALAPGGSSGYNTPVLWVDVVEAFNDLLDLRDFRQAGAYFKTKRRIKQTPLVVLDDVLQLREFDRIRELLFEVVNYRYAEKLPTIVTANIQNSGNVDTELVHGVGAPLARRLKEMSKDLVIVIQ